MLGESAIKLIGIFGMPKEPHKPLKDISEATEIHISTMRLLFNHWGDRKPLL